MSVKANLKKAYSLYREMRMLDRLSVGEISDSESAYLGRKAQEVTRRLLKKYGHAMFSICEKTYFRKHHPDKYFNHEWAVMRGLKNGLNETDARFFRFRFAMIRINNSFGVSNRILEQLANVND